MMIVYRRILLGDCAEVTRFALEALVSSPAVPLHTSKEKVRDWVHFFASHRGTEHFNRAAFDEEGKCVGAIALLVSEMPFFERMEGHVIFCFATMHGVGAKLIRMLQRWVHEDMRVRRVVWMMNEGGNQMARVLARRFGFNHRLEAAVYYKGG